MAELNRKLIIEEAKRNNLSNRLVLLEERLGEKDNVIHKLQKELEGYRERDYNNENLVELYRGLLRIREERPPNFDNFFRDMEAEIKEYDSRFRSFKDAISRDKTSKTLDTKVKSAMVSYVEKLDQLRSKGSLNLDHLRDATLSYLTVLENGIMKSDFEACMNVYTLRKESSIFFSVLEEFFAKVRLDEVGFRERFDELYTNFKRLKQSSARNS